MRPTATVGVIRSVSRFVSQVWGGQGKGAARAQQVWSPGTAMASFRVGDPMTKSWSRDRGPDLPTKTIQKTTMTPGSSAAQFERFASWCRAASRATRVLMAAIFWGAEGREKAGELVWRKTRKAEVSANGRGGDELIAQSEGAENQAAQRRVKMTRWCAIAKW